jgi:hypothetical protein
MILSITNVSTAQQLGLCLMEKSAQRVLLLVFIIKRPKTVKAVLKQKNTIPLRKLVSAEITISGMIKNASLAFSQNTSISQLKHAYHVLQDSSMI